MSDDSKPITREEIEVKYGSGPTTKVRKNPYLTALTFVGIIGTVLGLVLSLVPGALTFCIVFLSVGISALLLWCVAGAVVVAIESSARR
ncbi:hypothetical protein [Plantibacter sp. YIM 135249]|uniref:hypothetical protein n=1 Tax=Plantibacter sp. YIM 135249 TaxID=3423918 RepID=UPI003D357992